MFAVLFISSILLANMTRLVFILLLSFICTIVLVSPVQASLRGVKPSSAHFYQGAHFECDNGKKLPLSFVNDGYCDCVDGLDEPGTSACPRGRFFCHNSGFRGATIPSSWVDDGHCDCCDGSDESKGVCSDTCAAQLSAHQQSMSEEINTHTRGLSTRNQYVEHARAERERHLALVTETEARFSELEEKTSQLEQIKITAEDEYNALKEEIETKIKEEDEKDKAEGDQQHNQEQEEEDRRGTDHFQGRSADDDPAVTPLREKKEKAVQDWSEMKNQKDTVSRELEGYRKVLRLDFGPDMAFHGLFGVVYEFPDKEYIYKFNAFENVLQTKQGSLTTLGKWKGWDENKPNVMIYENGDRCWGGPDRSCIVTLICGEENKVIDVQEPNKCEYTMKVRTPAACSEAALNALKNGET